MKLLVLFVPILAIGCLLSLSLLLAQSGLAPQTDVHSFFPLSSNISTPLPPPDPNEFKISTQAEMVLLDVSVKKGDGGFASGLTKEQFKVLDNNTERTLASFEAGDIPVTLGLVIDNSGSMQAKRPEVVLSALTFVHESNPKDELFVVNFNDKVMFALPPERPFTDDQNQLRKALVNNPAQGRTALNDGIRAALKHLDKGLEQKKTLVVVSDGGDNASETTKAEILALAEASRATIYTIGIYDSDDRDRNPGFLKKLAAVTGGECFLPERLTDLVGVCRTIAKDIRNRYALGFVPDDASLDGKEHKIRVLATAPEMGRLIVRTRTHYIAVPHGGIPSVAKGVKQASAKK